MTDSKTLPVIGAAVTAPAWLPALAAVAPPLLIGATIGLALVAIFRDDKPKPATAPPEGAPPPQPKPAPKQERGFWDSFWNDGWFTEEEAKPATPAPVLTEAARQAILDNEAEIARERREIARLKTDIKQTRTQLANAYARPTPAVVTAQAVAHPKANAVAPVRPQPASPRPTIPAAPISALKAAVTPRPPAAPAASQVPAVIHQATPAPAVAVAAPVPLIVKPAPGKFQLFAPVVKREDVAAIFANGKRLARKDAVAALKARGVKQTTAYNALRDGGRFAALLDVGEDGLLAFRG